MIYYYVKSTFTYQWQGLKFLISNILKFKLLREKVQNTLYVLFISNVRVLYIGLGKKMSFYKVLKLTDKKFDCGIRTGSDK